MPNRVTLELVLNRLRRCHFAVLSTVDKDGISHSAGVNYGISNPGEELTIYVMTRRHLQKARNIAHNPNVSLVIPVPRPLLWFVPPATIQLRGRAEILDETDDKGTDVFKHFWMGRRILKAYEQSRRRGETRICFLKIAPDPVIRTYMVGYNIWEVRRRMESGAAKVVIPMEQLHVGKNPSAVVDEAQPGERGLIPVCVGPPCYEFLPKFNLLDIGGRSPTIKNVAPDAK